MKKTIFSLLVVGLIFLSVTACGTNKETTDELKFKKEYETLNNSKEYRDLSISEDNPFIYVTDKKIVRMINSKKTFYIYFGANWCPWCRSILPSLIEVAKENDIDKIYYVDITDIRDEYKSVGNIPELSKEGTKSYYKLIKKLNNVLDDYTITVDNDEQIKIGEKRIYVPLIIKIENGKATKSESGISDLQNDPYMKLNDEIIKDCKEKFNKLFK